ncbi:hypothetical protein Cob_v005208 [Colletotrichum orbiculare MAFF 240422]|uniref:Uncharacterized protein n=1 Tax=Colletotrichum orbiculare (strain 104-T / ATCC 96160 / CBS 514.97 / LARS 414 / MAFF 240422) TaxID=1213857 RepID=A0A484FV95_COLOR|nr:hypothetical protein Cob_v005208 [Colletotrichum orbiculare MAFF 240422]
MYHPTPSQRCAEPQLGFSALWLTPVLCHSDQGQHACRDLKGTKKKKRPPRDCDEPNRSPVIIIPKDTYIV